MDFSAYPEFEASFQQKYGELFERYPHASMMIEKQLRLAEAGETDAAHANMRKLARSKFGRRIRARLGSHLLRKPTLASGGVCYLRLPRFDGLNSRIEDFLRSRKMASLPKDHRWLMPHQRALDLLAASGSALPQFMSRALASGIHAPPQDRALMERLEHEAVRSLDCVDELIARWDIRLIIADGDSSPYLRVIGSAAKRRGCPFIVLAHGYAQNPKLISLAPIHADYLLTWTEQQAEDIRAVLPPEQRPKVLCFGYPKDLNERSSRADSLLIVWHPTRQDDQVEQVREIRAVIDRYTADGLKVRLRLHPKEDRRTEFLHELDREVEISNEALESALQRAAVVIGSRSSALVEAGMSGIPTYQLERYAREVPCEGTIVLDPHKDGATISMSKQDPPFASHFEFDRFGGFLDRLLAGS